MIIILPVRQLKNLTGFIKYRIEEQEFDRIVFVIDSRFLYRLSVGLIVKNRACLVIFSHY